MLHHRLRDLGHSRTMAARSEFFGLLQRAAHVEQERHDQTADDERDTPAPRVHFRGRDEAVEQHAERRREHHRHLLARGLPRAVEAAIALGRDLRQVDRHAAEFDARGKALQQPSKQDDGGRKKTDLRIARHKGDACGADRHQHQREDQTLAAAVMVDVGAEHERADRTHQKARAEHRKREHQRSKFVAGREERGCNCRRVIPVHGEVVHLEKIAAGDAKHRAQTRFP